MSQFLFGLILALTILLNVAQAGPQFIGWTDFRRFTSSTNAVGEVEWLSPKTRCRPADEFVPSWNAGLAPDGWLRVELRVFHAGKPTRFYDLGHWSLDVALHPRESIPGQNDADGNVDTDTLKLTTPADGFQFKLTLDSAAHPARLKLLAISATDARIALPSRAPLQSVWGRPPLSVPQRSQVVYPEGADKWCSPATTSMLLAFWSEKLNRPDLNFAVPDVARSTYDTAWKGTGNWAFNMAFAGSQPGLRAYVTRFNDVRELEDWIASGHPVGISVCYDRLRGKGRGPSGHLMVCVGFDETGNVVLNDPGSLHNTRKTFPRERLIDAWEYSKNTAYLIYPEGTKLPRDKFGHWTLNAVTTYR